MNRWRVGAVSLLALVVACWHGAGDENGSSVRAADTTGPRLSVQVDASARACDVLLDLGAAPANAVVFDPSVRGSYVQRASRFAVAFTSRSDAPPPASVAAFKDSLPAAPTVVSVACYDRTGTALPGAIASVQ